ncbi:MAG: hypothetical protein ABSA76_02590 [Bacteroidales bacterium]
MSYVSSIVFYILAAGFIYYTPDERLSTTARVYDNNESLISFRQVRISDPGRRKGYRDIIKYGDKFLAVGSAGRIDYISRSGEITPVITDFNYDLNGIICDDRTIIIVGENGIVLTSSDGQKFNKTDSGTKENINGIAYFNGMLIAAADKGTILISDKGYTWSSIILHLKGNIVSVRANSSLCFGVTDRGEIIKSSDGIEWKITDYNSQYAGYNKPCIFKNALLTDNRFVIIGQHSDETPAVLFSSVGNVWTERSLNYNDDRGVLHSATNSPNAIAYDQTGDQFFLACDNGEILNLPSCTKCNRSLTVSDNNLNSVICADDYLVCVGEGYFVNIIKIR